MSTRRYAQDAGFVDVRRLPKGPNGRALCRRCQTEVPKGRRTFCSDKCVHQHKLRTSSSYLRHCVFMRDKGVCCICRRDTERIKRVFERLISKAGLHPWNWLGAVERRPERFVALVRFRSRYGWFRGDVSPWAADHIVPVVEGGGECGLENIRTLCLGCHHEETRKLRRRLKLKRRDENRPLFCQEV